MHASIVEAAATADGISGRKVGGGGKAKKYHPCVLDGRSRDCLCWLWLSDDGLNSSAYLPVPTYMYIYITIYYNSGKSPHPFSIRKYHRTPGIRRELETKTKDSPVLEVYRSPNGFYPTRENQSDIRSTELVRLFGAQTRCYTRTRTYRVVRIRGNGTSAKIGGHALSITILATYCCIYSQYVRRQATTTMLKFDGS